MVLSIGKQDLSVFHSKGDWYKLKSEKIARMNKIEELEAIILALEHWTEQDKLDVDIEYKIGKVEDDCQKEAKITFLKENIELIKSTRPDDHKLYLSDIIKKERPIFGTNNLILAPVGSGKTTLIEEVLLEGQVGNILMLVSNTTLKDSICPNDLELRKIKGHRMFTSSNQARFGEVEYEIHVMTYSEFGGAIYRNNDFVKDVTQIYCDEIHSLPDYQQYSKDISLAHAIKYLFSVQPDKQIFYFTATDEYLLQMESRKPGQLKNVLRFDYRQHKDIKQYMALSEYKINHIEQIRSHLIARRSSFKYFGYKGIAYNRTITGQQKIAEIVKEEGYTPLILWSVNQTQEDKIMTSEQLRSRDLLINYGKIPEPYDFLIINSAMQEGWNLTDDKVKLAIMNTTSETEHIQSLGRLRGDIDILIYKTKDDSLPDIPIQVPRSYLNIPLTKNMKEDLCLEMNLINAQGKQSKWESVKKQILSNGYNIKEGQKTIEGRRLRVSTISQI